ncbi:SHC-transforming protein 4-like [Engraulis encrasicolus]|uniref:SHC-transforming protein 4-like n=1 Tax=Engraulis encrasicolus TaxID=184585 RepID=UPI002FD68E86
MGNIKISSPALLLGLRTLSPRLNPRSHPMPAANTAAAGGGGGVPGCCPTATITSSTYTTSTTSTSTSNSTSTSTGSHSASCPLALHPVCVSSSSSCKANMDWCRLDRPDCGVAFRIKYMGCLEVIQSMRALDFETRTQVTREAICRLCENVQGTKTSLKKRKPPRKSMSAVLGKSNLQFSGRNLKLSITMNSLKLTTLDSLQTVAHHPMQSISFASGGDPDTADYVAYVAKDLVNERACHILECPGGLAQEVINTIGQAFEKRFRQFLSSPPSLPAARESRVTPPEGESHHSLVLVKSLSPERPPPPLQTPQLQRSHHHDYYNKVLGKAPPPGGLQHMRLDLDLAELTGSPSLRSSLYENCPLPPHHKQLPPSAETLTHQMGSERESESETEVEVQEEEEREQEEEEEEEERKEREEEEGVGGGPQTEAPSLPSATSAPAHCHHHHHHLHHQKDKQLLLPHHQPGKQPLSAQHHHHDDQPFAPHQHHHQHSVDQPLVHHHIHHHQANQQPSLASFHQQQQQQGNRNALPTQHHHPHHYPHPHQEQPLPPHHQPHHHPHHHPQEEVPREGRYSHHHHLQQEMALSGEGRYSHHHHHPQQEVALSGEGRYSHHHHPQQEVSLSGEGWYHGRLSRREAESRLVHSGDFLVRESCSAPGQYVLSGLQGDTAKHLLLMDPQGTVRTKDNVFQSVGHLIRHHMDNQQPILSCGSELCLQQPVLLRH